MGRSGEREAEVLLLSNEVQNPHARDADDTISTPVPPLPDLNMHPFDLNMLPTEEEVEEEEHRDYTETHESEIQNPLLMWVNLIYVSYARMSMQLRN